MFSKVQKFLNKEYKKIKRKKKKHHYLLKVLKAQIFM